MPNSKLIIGLIGKDGRTTAIERALRRSPRVGNVKILSDWKNKPKDEAFAEVLLSIRHQKPDLVIVGPEEPLDAGIVDRVSGEFGIPCIGPTRTLAKLESSKFFTRELLRKHNIPGNPEYEVFHSTKGIDSYLRRLGEFVIKPDGLTGGKGVKVSGAHLNSVSAAVEYCREILHKDQPVIIEEKLEGEEFSLQSFSDGTHVVHMPLVQDHKRAFEDDMGPNTGGMGAYSCTDHALPFLTTTEVEEAQAISVAVARALRAEFKEKYKGILYGGFISTRDGIRLLEFNARFGDPEALNVLSILETDFLEVCLAITEERLHALSIRFSPLATVCKYVVPQGYPDSPIKGVPIDLRRIPKDSDTLKSYTAAIEMRKSETYLTGSRAIGFVGIGRTLEEAEAQAERAAGAVGGPVYHRKDIGTARLVQSRIDNMRTLKSGARHSAHSTVHAAAT